MTADDRLDQLEPMLAEAMTILDRHTAQLKQLSVVVSQLVTIATQQSDNISFILREQITMRADIAELKANQAIMQVDIAELKGDVAELKANQANINTKLDLILSKL